MFVPEVLQNMADSVVGHSRIAVIRPWTRLADSRWTLKICVRLSVPECATIPTETNWYLVFDSVSASVTIFPAKEGGITATHQHQSFNEEGPAALSWRTGNPCLQRPAAVFHRVAWTGEPEAIEEKLWWHLERLLTWIDAGASGELAVPGDPLELPTGPGQNSFPVVGFTSSDEDLQFWQPRNGQWGWADLARLPKSYETYGITHFRDNTHSEIRELKWGRLISTLTPSATALWIALGHLPVIAPWELPRTWADLTAYLKTVGVDLKEILIQAGVKRRHRTKMGGSFKMLFGFPLSHMIGDSPSRFHWLAFGDIEIADHRTKKNGFRAIEKTWRLMDGSRADSKSSLKWLRTVNWEPEEIRTRSGSEKLVPSKRVLVIGAGSLGSAVSENLVRMGLTEMGVLDADRLDIGNLTRHALGMDAVGHNKALALASALNLIMPDANVTGFASSFPPTDKELSEQVRLFDVIIDCSGSDGVLDALSTFDWGGEKTFVSLAMTWKAEGLLVYTASETSFPTVDAKESFANFDVPPARSNDARVEGIGCWHPVFPADSSDVRLWSAIGSKAILRAIRSPERRCEYFRQGVDGTVERQDA